MLTDCSTLRVRVEDIDAHYLRTKGLGARLLAPPTDFPYGERQYSVQDTGGHIWTFSQTMADISPEEWGGELVSV